MNPSFHFIAWLFLVVLTATGFAGEPTSADIKWFEAVSTKVINVHSDGTSSTVTTKIEINPNVSLTAREMMMLNDSDIQATTLANSKPATLVEHK